MTTPAARGSALWPSGLPAALLAIPIVWILLLLILSITQRFLAWPPPEARTIPTYCGLVLSLAPLALWLLDLGVVRPGDDSRQSEALADIERNRIAYEDMAWRARAADPAAVLDATDIAQFAQLTISAQRTTDSDALDALVEEADALAQRRAYLVPAKEISTEARSHLSSLIDWGVPAKKFDALKEVAAPALDGRDEGASRGALHVIFEEYDAWSSYIDEYNANTSFWASASLAVIAVLTTAALFMMLGFSGRVLALVLAAIAGATASVIARLPALTSYGEWVVNLRAYQARIGTGIVGSLVGIGLLGSGIITIALPKEWKSVDALLEACLSQSAVPSAAAPTPPATAAPGPAMPGAATPARCDQGGMLFLLGITMLLGFTERLLTSLEGRVVAPSGGAAATART